MELRILNADEVRRALPMAEAVEAMKRAFGLLSAGEVSMPLRSRIEIAEAQATALFMPAYGPGAGLAAKIVSVFPRTPGAGLPPARPRRPRRAGAPGDSRQRRRLVRP